MNKVLVAVAGAGKTHRISQEVSAIEPQDRVLILTYTVRNQVEDANRVAAAKAVDGKTSGHPRIMGWMSFLLNEIIRPYLPLLYPDVKLRGLGVNPSSFKYKKQRDRHFNKDGDVYPGTLAKLAFDIIQTTDRAPIARLELLYDSIYIDEGQDLCGNDLEVINELFKSDIETTVVLDPRQAVLATTKHDAKNKRFKGVKSLEFYRDLEKRQLCVIENLNETHRYVPEIARFSDLVIREHGRFPETISNVQCEHKHRGLFAIAKDAIRDYAEQYGAAILRWDKNSGAFPGLCVANFGECKGMQCDHVVVIATRSMSDFLLRGMSMKEETACKFYVAVTRARFSVAIALDNPSEAISMMSQPSSVFGDMNIQLWRS